MLVVTGATTSDSSAARELFVSRYSADGVLDMGFWHCRLHHFWPRPVLSAAMPSPAPDGKFRRRADLRHQVSFRSVRSHASSGKTAVCPRMRHPNKPMPATYSRPVTTTCTIAGNVLRSDHRGTVDMAGRQSCSRIGLRHKGSLWRLPPTPRQLHRPRTYDPGIALRTVPETFAIR